MLDSQLGFVIIYQPVWEDAAEQRSIVDFSAVYCNEGAEGLASLQRELLLLDPSSSLPVSDENPSLFQQLVHVWESGAKTQNRFYHATTDRYFRIVCRKLQQGVLVIASDITAEVKDRREVERLAQRLQTVISTSQSGVHTFKPVYDENGEIIDFRIMLVNQTIASYIGQTAEALTGALASVYFPAYKTNGIFDVYKDCYLNGTRHHFDFHYEDGYDVFFNLLVVKLDDEVLVTLTDHTALKRMQRELEASIAELKRSNSSLEQFAHAASHDLQEPLRKVMVYADRLLNDYPGEMDDTGFGYLERIRTATKRMHRLVQDLLVFAEVGANKNAVEEVDLNQLIEEVLSDLEVSIAERDAKVQVGKLEMVKGDSLHLQQLFQNLISNSLKYARHGVPPEISISSTLVRGAETGLPLTEQEMQQHYCLLECKDNGQGFSAEEARQIFKIFQRLPQHRNEQSGTGIGLAIVQRVVENHKGYITAEAVPGEGATFKVYLPLG